MLLFGVDGLWLVAFYGGIALLIASLAFTFAQMRKGFSLWKLLIAAAVYGLAFAVFVWFCNSAATRIPKDQVEKIRAKMDQKN